MAPHRWNACLEAKSGAFCREGFGAPCPNGGSALRTTNTTFVGVCKYFGYRLAITLTLAGAARFDLTVGSCACGAILFVGAPSGIFAAVFDFFCGLGLKVGSKFLL